MESSTANRRRLRVLTTIAIAVASGTVVACGSDSSAGSEEPIKIMIQGPFAGGGLDLPQLPGGAKAAVKAINADGGIHGRELELIECNEGQDPNAGVRCARDAVREGVVAETGTNSKYGDYLTVLEAAGIPAIGAGGDAQGEATSPDSFPISGGVPSLFAGMGDVLGSAGAKTVKAVLLDSPHIQSSIPFIEQGLAVNGVELAGKISVPLAKPDLAPAVASALSGGTDGVVLVLDPAGTTKFVREARRQRPGLKIAVSPISLPSASLEALGDIAEEVYVVSQFAPPAGTAAGVKRYVRDMDALDPEMPKDDAAANSWASVELLAQVARSLPEDDISAKSVSEALNRLDGVELGVAPPIQFLRPTTRLGKSVTRIFTTEVMYSQVKKTEVVPLSQQFTDPFER